MRHWVSIDDLFVVGIALDLIGGYLLARGLLSSPGDIGRRTNASAPRPSELNHHEASGHVQDRANGEIGLWTLGMGFVLQAAGYLLVIAGVPLRTGADRPLGAVVLGAIVAAVVLVGLRRLRRRRVRSLMVKVARFDSMSGELMDAPEGETLVMLGETIGLRLDKRRDEAWPDAVDRYARENFGVRTGTRKALRLPERTFAEELRNELTGL